LLGYFKYAFFLVANANELFGTHLQVASLALPLGISFFTFQKIAFLVDAYRGMVRKFNLPDYALFVTFFPQLIAGPIVHHSEFIPQLRKSGLASPNALNLALGMSIFCMGLFMKTVLADVSATFSDPVFNAAAAGQTPMPAQAWLAALAYSFQLYFDFAGYSAMAIGLARMFNIVLPLNFYSPYKAVNIIEFWRRWHITLSRFLRDYLYFPLGGNRRGLTRRYINLLVTMVLGGLWHGAAWTFVLWGAAHGVMLVINHAWHALLEKAGIDARKESVVGRTIAQGITFISVVVAWVPFRSTSFDAMRSMLSAMCGRRGKPVIDSFNEYFQSEYQRVLSGDLNSAPLWLACVAVIAFAAPNLYDLFRHYKPALLEPGAQRHFHPGPFEFEWTMSRSWALLTGILLVASLAQFGHLSPFLYFQF
jgi:D-alanyl-lipoteichoic acid acyltransferase DltB (MBOAT superfamily)